MIVIYFSPVFKLRDKFCNVLVSYLDKLSMLKIRWIYTLTFFLPGFTDDNKSTSNRTKKLKSKFWVDDIEMKLYDCIQLVYKLVEQNFLTFYHNCVTKTT